MNIVCFEGHAYNVDYITALRLVDNGKSGWYLNVHTEHSWFVTCARLEHAAAQAKVRALAYLFKNAGLELVQCEDSYYRADAVRGVTLTRTQEDTLLTVHVGASSMTHKGTDVAMALLFDDFVDKLRRV